EAREFILQALEQDSTNAEVLDHMGDIYSKLGEVQKAREYYRRALESNPDDQAIRNKLPVISD
ncbi:MAG: tetratricopeptide repeat protein, partial [Gammaproteobacteria bacterium]|nr:tetratricopeptide repeat protein [Gammaproteobacteria bacterium]NIW40733.1 tetratricopeptide repeat protein [candidate division Zixibacteria bacterium]NIX56411.1 tetratricopeptide repeat protein [candidate division Zixibacteria bacterium]